MSTKAQRRTRAINWQIYMVKGMQTIVKHHLRKYVQTTILETALEQVLIALYRAHHD